MSPTVRRTLAMTALLLTPALHSAMAQMPPAVVEPAPATTPAPAPAPAAVTAPEGAGFGSLGQIAISADLDFMDQSPQLFIAHESQSMGGGSTTAIGIRPSLDYFLAPHISVGGQIGISHGSNDVTIGATTASATSTVFGIQVRGGYDVPLTESVSLWPRLGIGYNHESFSSGGNDGSGYNIDLLVSVPVLWHPASHFFVGAGPALATQLVNKIEGSSVSKGTDLGISALIGGYFGGI